MGKCSKQSRDITLCFLPFLFLDPWKEKRTKESEKKLLFVTSEVKAFNFKIVFHSKEKNVFQTHQKWASYKSQHTIFLEFPLWNWLITTFLPFFIIFLLKFDLSIRCFSLSFGNFLLFCQNQGISNWNIYRKK